MQYGIYILGMLAAALTSLSYLPQLQKAIPRNYHVGSVAEDAGGTFGRSVPLGGLRRCERRLGDHSRQFDRCNALARRAWVQNSRSEFVIARVCLISCSGVQPEEAGNKENDDDDADDVENIHDVLRLRHARFQHESAALQDERSGPQVSSKDSEATRR
jgi:hypothetical protein